MKTSICVIFGILAVCVNGMAREETVEMVSGPDLTVRYDSAVWKPLAPLNPLERDVPQSMTWELNRPSRTQVTVASDVNLKDEGTFKNDTLLAQRFRGDAAELTGERHESIAGRNWLVLEFRNPHTRPERREIHYFFPMAEGHVRLFVVANESDLAADQEAIKSFLGRVRLR
jgi:hypothetical protein